tara:strand:+ start:2215 stop:3957 length:1743 start_codon:yes stop_codon:yes gene_type:complete
MATTYSDPNLEEDIFDTSADAGSDIAVNTGDINRMPTTLPGSMFQMPEKPANIGSLDLTPAMVNMENFATMFTQPAKTEAELNAMFPDASYKSDKYLALAKAGLALMQPTIGGRIAPSIANAGTGLLNDVAAISAKERAAKAKAKAGRISYKQQEAANFLQAKAQAFGINQGLITKELVTNYEQRAKVNASQWETYTKMANTNMKAALDFGMKKFESKPVKIRGMFNGVQKDMAGFMVNDQYYVPTTKKDAVTGDYIYEIVQDPTNIEIISSTTQAVDDVTKNMTQYNEIFSDYNNIAKNIYSLRQIMRSVDPGQGGDPTRVAVTGYIRRQVQKYGQIASDFTKDFFGEEYIDPVTGDKKGGKGKTVWLTDLSDIVVMSDDASVNAAQKENFKMINNLFSSLEADGMALIDRARQEDLNMHFEGDTDAERQANKSKIFSRLQFDTKIPENEARAQAIIYALARARKSSGRLNLDDIERAAETLNIYNDSSQAILTKLKVVEQELIAAHQVQADLLKRNFTKDAAQLAKERGGSLSYIVDGNYIGDNYYNNLFGYSNTPIKQTFTVVPKEGGGFEYVPVNQ